MIEFREKYVLQDMKPDHCVQFWLYTLLAELLNRFYFFFSGPFRPKGQNTDALLGLPMSRQMVTSLPRAVIALRGCISVVQISQRGELVPEDTAPTVDGPALATSSSGT